ncbi:hypothetical protein E2C01_033869 [Portunus trituberculatus]|uniref:Uncharacterized protein n=1 Tax=Portunus trituberculatus TaxID=210409 RepID=A0A5B7F6Y4_PORTR|nr:hypothetical protein [Portunus trituberculatus]
MTPAGVGGRPDSAVPYHLVCSRHFRHHHHHTTTTPTHSTDPEQEEEEEEEEEEEKEKKEVGSKRIHKKT